MIQAKCTVDDGAGGTCGRDDLCTNVRTVDSRDVDLNERWVCAEHRKLLGLPEDDAMINSQTGIITIPSHPPDEDGADARS